MENFFFFSFNNSITVRLRDWEYWEGESAQEWGNNKVFMCLISASIQF